ncbi:MAG: DUF4276 family protein [Sedimentisphaerales bacterium]|nr:DUF4276 family protein [Sedimentisphaerales bacterium]
MPKKTPILSRDRPVSLLILEGFTEEVFYPIIRDRFLRGIRIELGNIKGQGNINRDVLSEIFKFTYNNRKDVVRAYCCADTERQKQSVIQLDLDFIREQVKCRNMNKVLSVNAILADPEIESWFFYDIDGIYRFLQAKKSQRSNTRYANPKNLCKKDLQHLFSRFGKAYIPGQRASNFVSNLDINKILSNCPELHNGINLIKQQANDMTNNIFAERKNKRNYARD